MQVKTKNLMVGGLIVLLTLLLWYKMLYSPTASKVSKAHTAERPRWRRRRRSRRS